MSPESSQPLDVEATAQSVVEELQNLILQRYPEATFELRRGPDDPEAIQLIATVDLDDPDAVLDLVIDRMMELQIEHETPVFVIPMRTPERIRAVRQEALTRRPAGALLS